MYICSTVPLVNHHLSTARVDSLPVPYLLYYNHVFLHGGTCCFISLKGPSRELFKKAFWKSGKLCQLY